jgi:hypothetical protein
MMKRGFNVLSLVLVLVFALGVSVPAVLADGPGTTPCPGSLPTRLAIGSTGVVARSFSSLRNAPGGVVLRVMYTGAAFTVIDGPQCANGLTFFKLDYGGGVVGWASESEVYSIWGNNLYWLAPSGGSGTGGGTPATSCPGSLPTRLVVGGAGQVAQTFSTLRSSPAGPAIRIMTTGQTFTVLEGPICAGTVPLAFWRIDYGGGVTGWASESQLDSAWGVNQYWLAPLGAS